MLIGRLRARMPRAIGRYREARYLSNAMRISELGDRVGHVLDKKEGISILQWRGAPRNVYLVAKPNWLPAISALKELTRSGSARYHALAGYSNGLDDQLGNQREQIEYSHG